MRFVAPRSLVKRPKTLLDFLLALTVTCLVHALFTVVLVLLHQWSDKLVISARTSSTRVLTTQFVQGCSPLLPTISFQHCISCIHKESTAYHLIFFTRQESHAVGHRAWRLGEVLNILAQYLRGFQGRSMLHDTS